MNCIVFSCFLAPTTFLCQDAEELKSRGRLAFEKQQFIETIEICTRAITIDSKNAQAHKLRGLAFIKINEVNKAFADFCIAVKLNPFDFDALRYRGNTYWQKKQYDREVLDYDKAISLNPQDYKSRM